MSELVLKALTKTYHNVEAVKNLDLTIGDKEFMVIVGPSGCGKTTTLRLIAGLEEITSGDIYLDGEKISDIPPKDRDMAMVFQDYAIYPHMSVFDNIAFGLKMRKMNKTDIVRRVGETAEILNISHLLKRRPHELSGGERQRVALGRAIVRRPKVFLLDEPLANLDAALRTQMRGELSRLHQELGTTFVYVTHDQIEAMTMATKISVMDKGVLQQSDTPETIYTSPANTFVAGFIGNPKMNLIPGFFETREGELYLYVGEQEMVVPENIKQLLFKNKLIGKTLMLGIRPENISVDSVQQNSLKAAFLYSENTGADVYMHFTVQGCDSHVIARASAGTRHESKEASIHFNWKDVLLFDPDGILIKL